MSKENKKKTCPLSSNFAFAVITLLATGLLLYTTLEVFNCKQDIAQINERIQNSPKLVRVDNKGSEINGDSKVNKNDSNESEDVLDNEKETLIQSDPGITYNEDGTIDTSKWTLYKNEDCGFELLLPDFLEMTYSNASKSGKKYCNGKENSFAFGRVGGKEMYTKNKDRHFLSIFKISIDDSNYENDFNNYKKISFGKNDNMKGFISDNDEYGNSSYKNYLLGSFVAVHFENVGMISLYTTNTLNSDLGKVKNKEMKLLFDTILASFDY